MNNGDDTANNVITLLMICIFLLACKISLNKIRCRKPKESTCRERPPFLGRLRYRRDKNFMFGKRQKTRLSPDCEQYTRYLKLYFPLLTIIMRTPFSYGNVLSCEEATTPRGMDFCNLVDWNSARLYRNNTFLRTGSWAMPFSLHDQDSAAQEEYEKLKAWAKRNSRTCDQALKRLVCSEAFPECPVSGHGVSFLPPCRLLCYQAEMGCGMDLTCEKYREDNCVVLVEEGYFLLSDEQGPYAPLMPLYTALCAAWGLLAFVWLFVSYGVGGKWKHIALRLRHQPTIILARTLCMLPLMKMGVLIASLSFWSSCLWWGVCSFWMGVLLLNAQLIFQTTLFFGILLLAKGWKLCRSSFAPSEWRTLVTVISCFYIGSSILLVMRGTTFTQISYWLFLGSLYGYMYYYIFVSLQKHLSEFKHQVAVISRLRPSHNSAPVEAIIEKYRMFRVLRLVLAVYCAAEVSAHVVVEMDGRLWLALLVYEAVEVVAFAVVGWVFTPVDHSAFFFASPVLEAVVQRQPRMVVYEPVPFHDVDNDSNSTEHSQTSEGALFSEGYGDRSSMVISPCHAARRVQVMPAPLNPISGAGGHEELELQPLSRPPVHPEKKSPSQKKVAKVILIQNPDGFFMSGVRLSK